MKDKNSSINKGDNYIEQLKEWTENQYNIGNYLGGNIPYFVTNPGKPKLLATFLIFSGILMGLVIIYITVSISYNELESIIGIIVFILIFGTIALLQFLAGIRLLKKNSIKLRKYFTTLLGGITLLILTIFLTINTNLFFAESEVKLVSINDYQLNSIGQKNYIYLKEQDIMLECSQDIDDKLYNFKLQGELDKEYKIVFKVHALNPQEGVIISFKQVE